MLQAILAHLEQEVETSCCGGVKTGRECLAVQSSVFNDNHAYLALDKDPETCAVTGWATNNGLWWKVDLGSRKTMTGVILTGTQYTSNRYVLCVCVLEQN